MDGRRGRLPSLTGAPGVLAALLAAVLASCAAPPHAAGAAGSVPPHTAAPADGLDLVAAALDRPAGDLRILDRSAIDLLFVEGRYDSFVVRDVATGRTARIALDLDTGDRVDPAALHERDRALARERGGALEPDLLDLLLRHPDLERVLVRARLRLDAGGGDGGHAAPIDWSDPRQRRAFLARLEADLARRGVTAPLTVDPRAAAVTAALSPSDVLRLGASDLVESVALAAEPIILDAD